MKTTKDISVWKPCPFCGEEKHLHLLSSYWYTHVECEECNCHGPLVYENELLEGEDIFRKAVVAWNARSAEKGEKEDG